MRDKDLVILGMQDKAAAQAREFQQRESQLRAEMTSDRAKLDLQVSSAPQAVKQAVSHLPEAQTQLPTHGQAVPSNLPESDGPSDHTSLKAAHDEIARLKAENDKLKADIKSKEEVIEQLSIKMQTDTLTKVEGQQQIMQLETDLNLSRQQCENYRN